MCFNGYEDEEVGSTGFKVRKKRMIRCGGVVINVNHYIHYGW